MKMCCQRSMLIPMWLTRRSRSFLSTAQFSSFWANLCGTSSPRPQFHIIKQVHFGSHPLMPQSLLPSMPLLLIHHNPSRVAQASSVPVSSALTCLVLIQSVSDIIPSSSLSLHLLCILLLVLSFFNPSGISSQLSPSPSSLIQQFSSLPPTSAASFLRYWILILCVVSKSPPAVQKSSRKILFCCDYIMDHA